MNIEDSTRKCQNLLFTKIGRALLFPKTINISTEFFKNQIIYNRVERESAIAPVSSTTTLL